MSLSNRLLKFRPTKRRTLRVDGTTAKELFSNLIGKERFLRLVPAQHNPIDEMPGESTLEDPVRADIFSRNNPVRSHSKVLPPKSEDTSFFEIQTAMGKDELIRKLSYIHRQTQGTIEEQGYTPLYLALNFLEWTESPDSMESCLAPLILVPVGIRLTSRNVYEIFWTTEEVQDNYAIKVKLQKQGLELPEVRSLDNWKSIEEFFVEINRIASENDGWEVQESIYLDFFNFTKIIMYKDLNPRSWPTQDPLLDNHLLKLIFDPKPDQQKPFRLSEDEIDEVLDFKARFYVMDADPSQIAAIEDVRALNNLVVQGPPGTGKSQTIVNIIADTLSAGKTVLFVSEKLAALEVVKKRLDDVKLGDFCLELHSRKSNKKQFIEALRRILDVPSGKPVRHEAKFAELGILQKRLNEYAEAIRTPCCARGKSPFVLIGEREAAIRYFLAKGKKLPSLKLNQAILWSNDKWNSEKSLLRQLAEVFPTCQLQDHTFYGCEPTGSGHFFKNELRESLNGCRTLLQLIQQIMTKWAESYGIFLPQAWEDCQTAYATVELIEASSRFEPVPVAPLVSDTPDELERARTLIKELAALQEQRVILGVKFKPDSFNERNLDSLAEKHFLDDNWHILRHPIKHHSLMSDLLSLYKQKPPKPLNRIKADLERLELCIRAQKDLDSKKDEARSVFGRLWQGPQSNCEDLSHFVDWAKEFKDLLRLGMLSNKIIEVLKSGLSYRSLRDEMDAFRLHWQNLQKQHRDLGERLKPDYQKLAGREAECMQLSELLKIWDRWDANLDMIHDWNLFLEKRKECSQTDAEAIVSLVESGVILPEDMTQCLKGLFAASVLDEVFEANANLKSFKVTLHQKRVEEFAQLDRHLVELNHTRLSQHLRKMRYQFPDVPQAQSEKFLKREMSKQRNHKSVRTIFAQASSEILGLKPCVMMSPLSVAQFLQPGKVSFDVVIFDEASQIRSEDALGATVRAKQIVVIGDSKQLPPTNFFDVVMDDSDEDAALTPYESILERCEASGFAKSYLKWHYRSEHESLIAVSNQQFYDNKLVIYPSPIQRNDKLGLHFHHVPDGVYDRGDARTNRVEARLVAEQAIQHYRNWPTATLGIGTFSLAQSEVVIDQIQALLTANPDLERYFSQSEPEYCFVKNLETIQGDERDVIFISVGYGFDSDRKLSRNFGPVNQDGGERRLNVLITRARKKCVVFANFLPSDLAVDPNANKGVHSLKAFLEYAESGHLSMTYENDFESEFERSVCECLRGHGFEVHPQVESVGYRIDLAIPHPSESGRYLLGIECDGRKYHSSRVSRERDRLRQQILEQRGWKIIRLWSTDWYWQRLDAEHRLVTAIKNALDEARQDAATRINERLTLVAPPDPEVTRELADEVSSEGTLSSTARLAGEESVNNADVTFRVPPLKKLLIPLLHYVHLHSDECNPNEQCLGIEEEYWITVKDEAELEGCSARELVSRFRQGFEQLVERGFLKRYQDESYKITERGISELVDWGLM
jgi:very-short-patch-repair endonuclease